MLESSLRELPALRINTHESYFTSRTAGRGGAYNAVK